MSAVIAATTLRPSASSGFLRRAAKKPLGVISVAYLLAVTLACVLAPLVAPYGPQTQDLLHADAGPSAAHLLGTDELGRDVLSRLLYGGQITLFGVVECVAVLLMISVPVGLVAGYVGGALDRAVNAIVDIMLALPGIIIVLAVLSVFGSNMTVAMVTFGILGSAGVIRVVRSATLSVRQELYIAAARVSGVSEPRIIFRHVLPRIAGPVIVQASLWSAFALGVQTGLAFLQLGVTPPAPSWGGMVGDAAQLIYQDPWLLVPSGGIIALTILAFGLIGDTVRDVTFERWSRGGANENRPIGDRNKERSGTEAGKPAPRPFVRPNSTALLSVCHLSVDFTGPNSAVSVVSDISFTVDPGEVLGIVGESGSGKSVTALSILGLLPSNGHVSGGRVYLGDRELTAMSERELTRIRGSEVSIVFQEPMVCLDPSFLVGSQVLEVVRQHEKLSRPKARARVLELLKQVRLPDPAAVARLYPHELSGGMAQRVCIALALAGRPRLLIADEPTTALDVTVQAEILGLLRTLQGETGMAVILVTHDWGVIADLCDRAIVMYAGQLVEVATVADLFCNPRHPYTLGLQECNPDRASVNQGLPAIPGSVPPPEQWTSSCRFYERCRFATPECNLEPIELERDEAGREVRCLHWRELASLSQRS